MTVQDAWNRSARTLVSWRNVASIRFAQILVFFVLCALQMCMYANNKTHALILHWVAELKAAPELYFLTGSVN